MKSFNEKFSAIGKYLAKPTIIIFLICLIFFPANILRERSNPFFHSMHFFNIDSASWLLAAKDFPHNLNLWKSRPLYPFLIFSVEKIISLSPIEKISETSFYANKAGNFATQTLGGLQIKEYISTLISALILNFILYYASALIFFTALRKLKIKLDGALTAAVIYATSLLILTWIGQPLPQIFDYFIIAVLFYFYTLYKEKKFKVSNAELIFATLLCGLFLLVKPFLFIPITGIIVLTSQKQWFKLFLFLSLLLLPYLSWYLLLTKFFMISWYDHSITNDHRVTWLVTSLYQLDFQNILYMFYISIVNTANNTAATFFSIIIFFVPFKKIQTPLNYKEISVIFLLFFSMIFAMEGSAYPRLCFYLFPLIILFAAQNLISFANRFNQKNLILVSFLIIYALINYLTMPYLSFS
jgi:hypothetical protein